MNAEFRSLFEYLTNISYHLFAKELYKHTGSFVLDNDSSKFILDTISDLTTDNYPVPYLWVVFPPPKTESAYFRESSLNLSFIMRLDVFHGFDKDGQFPIYNTIALISDNIKNKVRICVIDTNHICSDFIRDTCDKVLDI